MTSAAESNTAESSVAKSAGLDSTASDPTVSDSTAAESETPDSSDYPAVEEVETFRVEVLDRLESLESAVTGTRLRARVVDGGENVTMLRLLDDADLEHGEEIAVVVPDGDE